MKFCDIDTAGIDINLYNQFFDNGWSFAADIATHESCNDGTIYRSNIPIQIGKQYKITYDILTTSSGAYVNSVLGNSAGAHNNAVSEYTETLTTTSGVQFGFFGHGDISIKLKYVVELSSGNGITIAYNENTKSFSSFYSYIPEKMATLINDFFTFHNGKIYLHNVANNGYNTFYENDLAQSELVAVINNNPSVVKSFLGIFLDASSVWQLIDTANGPGIETNNLQESNLITSDFNIEDLGGGVYITKKEGVYYANFYRDTNSPGGLAEGDVLNGNWIKLRLSNNENNFVSLWSLFVNQTV